MELFKMRSEIELQKDFDQAKRDLASQKALNSHCNRDYGNLKKAYDKKVGVNCDLSKINDRLEAALKKASNLSPTLTTVKTFSGGDPAYLRDITNIATSDEFAYFLATQREGFLHLMGKATSSMERDVALGMIQGLDRLKKNLINHAEQFEAVSHEQTV